MIDTELLKIMCCPETHQPLSVADPDLISRMNQAIASGQIRNRAGEPVTEPLDSGLVREDRQYLYPIRQDIPVMLIDEALPLNPEPPPSTSET